MCSEEWAFPYQSDEPPDMPSNTFPPPYPRPQHPPQQPPSIMVQSRDPLPEKLPERLPKMRSMGGVSAAEASQALTSVGEAFTAASWEHSRSYQKALDNARTVPVIPQPRCLYDVEAPVDSWFRIKWRLRFDFMRIFPCILFRYLFGRNR